MSGQLDLCTVPVFREWWLLLKHGPPNRHGFGRREGLRETGRPALSLVFFEWQGRHLSPYVSIPDDRGERPPPRPDFPAAPLFQINS